MNSMNDTQLKTSNHGAAKVRCRRQRPPRGQPKLNVDVIGFKESGQVGADVVDRGSEAKVVGCIVRKLQGVMEA